MPQKSLPQTIVQRIFQAYHTPCHIHPHRRCRIRSCVTSSPLLLGKICKEWRRIAWEMPDLWTWIEITVPSSNPEVRFHLAREWLQRASGKPLTVIVHPLSVAQSPSSQLFNLIGMHSMQWSVLDITVYAPTNGGRNSQDTQPSLTHLRIGGATDIDGNIHPWRTLASLSLMGLKMSMNTDFLVLMTNSPNLEVLRIEVDPSNTEEHLDAHGTFQSLPPTSVHVVLPPRLKSLVIWSWKPFLFLDNVTASSSLVRLSIIIQGVEGLVPATIISTMDFITRSQCSLRAFGLSSMATLNVEIVESLSLLFTRIASTKFLFIHSNNTRSYKQIANQIPDLLNPSTRISEGKDILLPNLQVFYYSIFNLGIVPQKLLDMVKCRCQGHDIGKGDFLGDGEFAKLKVLRFNKTNPQVLLDPLRMEIQDGLEITYDLPYRGEPFE